MPQSVRSDEPLVDGLERCGQGACEHRGDRSRTRRSRGRGTRSRHRAPAGCRRSARWRPTWCPAASTTSAATTSQRRAAPGRRMTRPPTTPAMSQGPPSMPGQRREDRAQGIARGDVGDAPAPVGDAEGGAEEGDRQQVDGAPAHEGPGGEDAAAPWAAAGAWCSSVGVAVGWCWCGVSAEVAGVLVVLMCPSPVESGGCLGETPAGQGAPVVAHAPDRCLRFSTPYAGANRIRCEGLRLPALSALARSPVVTRRTILHACGRVEPQVSGSLRTRGRQAIERKRATWDHWCGESSGPARRCSRGSSPTSWSRPSGRRPGATPWSTPVTRAPRGWTPSPSPH